MVLFIYFKQYLKTLKMTKNIIRVLLFSCISVLIGNPVFAQYKFDENQTPEFQKRELNWGVIYNSKNDREEFLTDNSRNYEELVTGAASFRLNSRYWDFLDYKQEHFDFNVEIGPLWGNGNWIDSTHLANQMADHNIFGMRGNAAISYSNRFFYNNKNYTIIQINSWGRYDLYNQNSKGTSADSNNVITNIGEKTNETKFRYGFEAKAGWGIGRLNPVNHFMIADYLMQKYYSGRNFSQEEIVLFAQVIGDIKHQRNIKTGHAVEKEAEQIGEFLRNKMFLSKIDNLETDWQYGEFAPRFQGSRLEFGPFFKYFNREPDFVYGGYVHYKNAKYYNYKWNRNFSATANYNRYKRQDWAIAEIDLGWSYFMKLKSQVDFGLKYVPGITINDMEIIGSVKHGVIPYFGYFSQINSKTRVNLMLALRISADETLMLPGPEISLSIYNSRY